MTTGQYPKQRPLGDPKVDPRNPHGIVMNPPMVPLTRAEQRRRARVLRREERA